MMYTIIIPARLGSTRLPNKMLEDIAGKPMIQHTWERAKETYAKNVCVVTDSQEIADIVDGFGGDCLVTHLPFPNGTTRVAWAAKKLDLSPMHIVVNLQGDEPFISSKAIMDMVQDFSVRQFDVDAGTLAVEWEGDIRAHSDVKVVVDNYGYAIMFSRENLPCSFHHMGAYVYRAGVLEHLANAEECDLEKAEGLEQLRWLYYRNRIYVHISKEEMGPGVDTIIELEEAKEWALQRKNI